MVRIAVRCRKQDGQWAVGVLISTVLACDVLHLTGKPPSQLADPQAVLWAYVTFYEKLGGGIETSLKDDKQGLGLTKRNKKRGSRSTNGDAAWQFDPYYNRLGSKLFGGPQLRSYGMLRMVRDIFHISGFLGVDALGQIVQIGLGFCGSSGSCPRRLVAGSARSCSHGHSSGQTFPCSKNHGR